MSASRATNRSAELLPRRRLLGLVGLCATGSILTACASRANGLATTSGPLVARPDRDEWPPIFWRASADARTAYRYAVGDPSARGLLAYIPCYCGCGGIGHRSNLDCYLDLVERDRVILDNHGFG